YLRSGMDEIDVYPSQTLLYRSFTAILGGLYLAMVGALWTEMSSVGGEAAFPLRALVLLLALAGLPVLMLSDRGRQRLQRFVSEHLRRPLYDYRKVWNTCTQRTSSLARREDVCEAVVRLVAETLNVLSVTIWLVDPDRKHLAFGASTCLSQEKALR